MWNHETVIEHLRKLISEKAKIEKKSGIEHYYPDIFCKIDGKKVVFEIETYANPSKIVQAITFSYAMGANELVIIFSNKHGRGKTRQARTESMKRILCKHFPQLCSLKVLTFYVDCLNDLDEIIKTIL